MAQWGKNDVASNSVVWGPAQLNQAPSRANANLLFGNTTSDGYITGATHTMAGADEDETAATPVAHAGWQLVVEGSGGRAGRVQRETLVALSSMIGDASDDAVLGDFLILITTQPADDSTTDGGNASFTVVAESQPSGESLTYQWQSDPIADGTWGNVADAGIYSGATTDTLTLTAALLANDGELYRVVISGTGADSVTSDAAELTVTA